jgi:hypothetical protein
VEGDPYQIWTAADMQAIGGNSAYWGAKFELMADIDLSGYTGTSFNIIGNSTTKFTGVFDGNGHTISNFTYTSTGTSYIGVFGYVTAVDGGRPGEIRDLGLINPNVDAGTGDKVGSLVGWFVASLYDGRISGCYVEGGTISGNSQVGGLVGHMEYGVITNCYSTGSVSGLSDVGGLVGVHSRTMTNCSSNASVSGNEMVGGLVGRHVNLNPSYPSTISNCYSTGSVSGLGDVGGLVGRNTIRAKVRDSYSTASVTGYWSVGGLVGFIGAWCEITNCYSAGGVSGISDVGGLLGSDPGSGEVYDSFWDVNTSGQETSAGGSGLTTALMQSAFIFTTIGWDFVGESANGTEDFWDICEGMNYAKLAWQVPVLGDFSCPDGVDGIDLGVLCEEWLLEELSADVGPDGGDGFVNFLDWAFFADGWGDTYDIFDLADFAGEWLKRGVTVADIAPYGGDGIVNMADFAVLAENWLEGEE